MRTTAVLRPPDDDDDACCFGVEARIGRRFAREKKERRGSDFSSSTSRPPDQVFEKRGRLSLLLSLRYNSGLEWAYRFSSRSLLMEQEQHQLKAGSSAFNDRMKRAQTDPLRLT